MLDSHLDSKIDFYNQPKYVENPHHPAGFNGTFAFSSHQVYSSKCFMHFYKDTLDSIEFRELQLKTLINC